MINEKQVKKFCKDYTKIENYEDAVNDTAQVWHCHHILGEILTRQQLKDHDFYYDVPPCMLKFVTKTEHTRLHWKGKKRKPFTEEHRKKISEAMKGYTVSEETRKKLSEANKGHTVTEDTRRKISEANKNMSEDRRRKMSESNKGEKNPMYGRTGENHPMYGRTDEKSPFYGKHHSEETRRKISEAMRRKKF